MTFRTRLGTAAIMIVASFAIGVAGCAQRNALETGGSSRGDGRLTVYVVNYPLKYFAERIGGDLVTVAFPAPANVDPAYWKPDATTVQEYQQADVILLNGADYARWLSSVSLPESKLVNTTAAVQDQYIEVADAVVHSHGPGGEHSHTGFAFTTWLDPRIALAQATAVHAALLERLPDHQEALDESFAMLRAEMQDLDARLTGALTGYDDQPLLASHPVYQYLERRGNLNLRSLHWEPDEAPDDAQWTELEKLLADHPARWMLWEATPLQTTSDRLNALGIECLVYAPCGNVPANGDFLVVMHENLGRLAEVATAGATP